MSNAVSSFPSWVDFEALPLTRPRPPRKERDLRRRLFPLCWTVVYVDEIQITDGQNNVVYISTPQTKTKTTTVCFPHCFFSFSVTWHERRTPNWTDSDGFPLGVKQQNTTFARVPLTHLCRDTEVQESFSNRLLWDANSWTTSIHHACISNYECWIDLS